MLYTTEDATLFNMDSESDQPPVKGYRQKLTRYGDMMDIEIGPVWDTRPAGVRSKRVASTRPAQRNQNCKNARKKFVYLLNGNFGKNDYHTTYTYEKAPNEQTANRDVKNVIRRWQSARKRTGLKPGKYMFVIEFSEEENKRIHMHLILEGGLGRDEIESLWKKGRSNCRRLQPDEFGLTGLATYLSKDPRGKKRWGASRGLKRPKITYKAIRKRRAEKIAADEYIAPTLLEKEYRDYKFLDMLPARWSEFVSGFYLYARMRKREERKHRTA